MSRFARKVDTNHTAVVEALRRIGCTVQSLAAVGEGCPDLLVSRAGVNILLEVKDGERPPSQRKLTVDQMRWMSLWRGPMQVVYSPEDAVAEVTRLAPLRSMADVAEANT